ncbi:MAG: hypothetical protein DYH08_13425, partial [Actinobacteria bacterium ATB1]|nr:hypothetical protein [Actinobacteria bacterium ATB1]
MQPSPWQIMHSLSRGADAKGARLQKGTLRRVLGYVGPFRVGILGNKNPRWCIFADEHHATMARNCAF